MNEDDLLREIVREEFPAYLQCLNPKWVIPDFHMELCQALCSESDCLVSLPPDHAKSTIASVYFPTWFWGRFPDKKIIIAVGNPKLVSSFSIQIRQILENQIFLDLFDLRMRADSDAISMRNSIQGGSLYLVSKASAISGLRADLIVFDDIIASAAEAMSQTNRDSAWRFLTQDLFTRATPGAKKIGIGTRWHEDDVLCRLEKNPEFKDFLNIKFPAIDKEGRALWPERHDIEDLNSIKNIIGSQAFEALYQQNPLPAAGGLFKRSWWKFYKERPDFSRIVQSWDCAQKVGITNDYSVCTTWGEAANGYYLIDLWRERVEAPQLEQAAKALFGKHNPSAVIIEDKVSGTSLIQTLRQQTRMPIIPYDPRGRDKQVRASASTPMVEAGKIFLPEGAPFVEDFILECERFPFTDHDDQVDSFSQFIEYVRKPQRNLRALWI